ncbi:hypothetical protein BAPKO_0802 [Borreliella afzelii PKo]|nr:hypothetical protein BAPKO_0802 [Borreliella afzelii PKo]
MDLKILILRMMQNIIIFCISFDIIMIWNFVNFFNIVN